MVAPLAILLSAPCVPLPPGLRKKPPYTRPEGDVSSLGKSTSTGLVARKYMDGPDLHVITTWKIFYEIIKIKIWFSSSFRLLSSKNIYLHIQQVHKCLHTHTVPGLRDMRCVRSGPCTAPQDWHSRMHGLRTMQKCNNKHTNCQDSDWHDNFLNLALKR